MEQSRLMLTAEEERFILASAYVPEHIVGLMTCISGGEPYLVEDHFCCSHSSHLWRFLAIRFMDSLNGDILEKMTLRSVPRSKSLRMALVSAALRRECKVSVC